MTTYVADIETNGFLSDMTTIHSLCFLDADTGEEFSCADQPGHMTIEQGIRVLMTADRLVFHNGIKFDLPAIQKLYPFFKPEEGRVFDTLVASRLIWSQLVDTDMTRIRAGKTTLTPKLAGSHGLEAWGHRLGNWKGDYAKLMKERGLDPWASWSEEMQLYCRQDIKVTELLYRLILDKNYSEQALELEHRVAFIMAQVERNGFQFNVRAAEELYVNLAKIREDLGESLRTLFPPWQTKNGPPFVPKRDNARLGYKAGVPVQKYKEVVFNPNSRDQIADRLMTLKGWKPTELTPSGKPKVDETILEALPYPEAKELSRYMLIQKRIGQLAEGDNAWLKKVDRDGRIHGSIITNGAVTGRATHSNPNIAQVPKVGTEYGKECRGLFTARPGKTVLLGCDVSGLELRMLGHFMARHDDGEYGREVVEGDVHTVNMNAAGLSDRNQAKTMIYGFLYGAGDSKLGSIIGRGRKAGAEMKRRLFKKVPALKQLVEGVQGAASRGHLVGLDGRLLHIRSPHAALNTLLQSAGALICKQWLVRFDELLKEQGYADQVQMVAWVHDEVQMEIAADLDESWTDYEKLDDDGNPTRIHKSIIGDLCIQAIEMAGHDFNIRVPLSGEYKIGPNWAKTH